MDDIVFIAPVPPAPAAYAWYVDTGAFLDRFGTCMMPVLLSTDTVVQALLKNLLARKWVDLRRPDVIDAVNYIAGETVQDLGTISTPIEGMTAGQATAILTTVPSPDEQMTTVKLYFS